MSVFEKTKTIFFHNEIQEPHYYGDRVRLCFAISAIFMLITLPFYVSRIPIPLYGAIMLIILMVLFAGVTNPRQKWTAILDWSIALIGSYLFEYYAVMTYIHYSWLDGFMWINQILAIIFIVALYFATKTVRGFILS